MYFYVSLVATLLLINSLFLFSLGTYLLISRTNASAIVYAMLMYAVATWSFFGAAESAAITIEGKILFASLSYLGIVAVGPLWLLFSMHYGKLKKNIIKLTKIFASIFYFLMLLLTFSNSYHNLLWNSYNFIGTNITQGVLFGHGPIWYVNTVLQYLMIVTGILILARLATKTKGKERNSLILIIISTIVPLLGNFIFISSGPKFTRGADLAPISFCITGAIVIFSIFKYSLFSTLSLAMRAVYQNINIGIIILNSQHEVSDYNNFAKKIFKNNLLKGMGINELDESTNVPFLKSISTKGNSIESDFSGRSISVLSEQIDDSEGDNNGYVITVDDISDQIKSQQKLDEQLRKISKINEAMVGRELKMIELKNRIRELENEK